MDDELLESAVQGCKFVDKVRGGTLVLGASDEDLEVPGHVE